MPTRAEVDLLRAAQAELTKRVRRELASLAGTLTGNPQAIRDTLLQVVPALVAEYGEVAATISAEWFEEVYGARAAMAAPIRAEFIEQGVRYAAGHLFEGNTAATISALDTKLDKWIKQAGRDTVRLSANRHGYAWARVPQGAKTCSFCLVLASRDAVYASERSATRGRDGEAFHGACDCVAVALRDGEEYPAGYLPDEYYEMYSTARDNAESGSINDITASMRKLYPDQLTDGVHQY